MKELREACHPVLSCASAAELEKGLFGGDETKEWAAMQAAGAAIAAAIQADAREIGGLPVTASVLVLVGKGHNGGDALIAAAALLRSLPRARATVILVFGERALRPLAHRAWRDLQATAGARVCVGRPETLRDASPYDVALDGIFGFQFRPPVAPEIGALIASANAARVRLRVAIDLPSADLFGADFTYATGSVKQPVLESEQAGRVRYLDLGFFRDRRAPDEGHGSVLTADVLEPLRGLRPSHSDKRSYGHVFLLGGSRSYPGAILMAALSAVRSGAGLVTVFAPEALVPAYAARLPEAMWVGYPETPRGGLALEGEHLVRERLPRATALVLGPGADRDPETLALFASLVGSVEVPVVLDADALQTTVLGAARTPVVLTPHRGEYQRLAGDRPLQEFAAAGSGRVVVLKGPIAQISNGQGLYYSLAGGPVLARGGSGDLLAGMIGAQLAQTPQDPLAAACRAVVWHGRAADELARERGQVAVATTELLDYLAAALR